MKTPKPTAAYYDLEPAEAMAVARKVAKRNGEVDFNVLLEWTLLYQENHASRKQLTIF